jgi:DNA-binding NtrC family response regulator
MSGKPSLLLVDDEASVLLTLSLVFERDGYLVRTAASFAEGLAILKTGPRFDVVVTDLCLEEDDIGLELARQAAKLRQRPVIVLITGFASVENARIALQIPVDHYAIKPLDLDELRNALNRLLVVRRQARHHMVGGSL